MAKTKISEFDATAANNTDINSVNIAEGCAPSGINNAIRETMAALKRFQTGADGDPLTVGGNLVVTGNATLGDASGDSVTINAATVSTPNGLNFDSNTLVIDATNDRVGIGTASPGEKLSLSGNLRVDTGYIYFAGNTSTPAVGAGIYRPAADTLGFVINNTERLRIDSSGNVGIGTTAPAGKFNVGGGRSFFGANSETYSIGVGYTQARVNAGQTYYIGATDSATPSLVFSNAGGTERMRIDSSGNVGIGTSSPESKFHVVGSEMRLTGSSSKTSINLRSSSGAASWIHFTEVSVADRYLIGHPAGSADLVFRSNSYDFSSGTERMRIDSSGNVGIGTSSPSTKLDVYSSTWAQVKIQGTGGSGWYGSLDFSDTGSTGVWRTGVRSDGEFWLEHPTGSAANIVFRNLTSNAESVRIDSSGNLLVGTTVVALSDATSGTGIALQADGQLEIANSGVCARFNRHTSDGTIAEFRKSGTTVGSISVTSSATAYNTSSDYRLKENIAPMTGALATVAQLNPVTYTWKADGSAGQGFIAHELQAVVPDCVTGEKDAVDADGNPQYQGVDTSFLVATLTAAIQELKAENDALKSRLDAAGL